MKELYYITLLNGYRTREMFATQICNRFESKTIRVISIQYANSTSQGSKLDHAMKIYQHFYDVGQIQIVAPRPIRTHPFDRSLSIPLSRNTAQHNQVLPWFIDRNPSVKIESTTNKYDIHLVQNNDLIIKENHDCSICYNKIEQINAVELNCHHQFCVDCICCYFKTNKKTTPTCALCREPMKNINVYNKDLYDSVSVYCHN
jgi:hypothetical protein